MKKALTSTNEKLRRSSRAKTHVTRLAYNEYMAHNYALAMMVVDPSLRHRLEGENKPRATSREKQPRRESRAPSRVHREEAARSRAHQRSREEPRTLKPRRAAHQQRRDEEPRREAAKRRRDEEPRNKAAKKAATRIRATEPREAAHREP